MSDDTPQHPIPDEVKVDVDQEALAQWDEVSGSYAGEGEADKRRPAFADDKVTSEQDADEICEDDSRSTDSDSDDNA